MIKKKQLLEEIQRLTTRLRLAEMQIKEIFKTIK